MSVTRRCVVQGTFVSNTAGGALVYRPPVTASTTMTGTMLKVTVCNVDAGASYDLKMWILKEGVSSTSDQYKVGQHTLLPVETYDCPIEVAGHTLNWGDALWMEASAASKLTVRITAAEKD